MRSYLICSVQRSGSTWFSSLLESTGVAGRPVTEYWNLGVEKQIHEQGWFPTYRSYLAHVREQAATPNGIMGANIMWRQMPGALARMNGLNGCRGLNDMELWQRALPNLGHFILTFRKDTLAQAVSWAIAHQTRQFTCHDEREREPEYDFWLIDTLYHDIKAHNLAWLTWFERFDIVPETVVYENLLEDPAAVVHDTLKYLRIKVPVGWRPETGLRPQRSSLNKEWCARWKEESSQRHITPAQYYSA